MVSSTALTLVVIPAIYAVVKGFGLQKRGTHPSRVVAVEKAEA